MHTAYLQILVQAGNMSSTEIKITTQLMGPYMFPVGDSNTSAIVSTIFSPIPVPGLVNVAGTCSGNQTCQQELTFTIHHTGACRLDGIYSINQFPVVCQPDLLNGTYTVFSRSDWIMHMSKFGLGARALGSNTAHPFGFLL